MSLPELLEATLRRHGPLVALEAGEVARTYAWLDLVTRGNADFLRSIVEPENRVLIVGEHSTEAIVWAISVMRSGLVYTPLNPHLPAEQMRASISVADPGLIICFDEPTRALLEQRSDCRVLRGDHADATDDFPNSATTDERRTSVVAYSIFTSGSTGLPKLVNVGHEGLPELCTEQQRVFDLGPGQRVMQFSALSFDASIAEMLVTLYAGATLVVPERRSSSWLSDVNRHLSRSGCDLATFPSSVYARLDQAARQAVGAVVFAGEPLTEAEYARAAECGRVYNAYGPTEGSVCFSIAEVTGFSSSIGRPIAGFRARVFDVSSGDYTHEGQGELVIVGPGVALGYEGGPPEDNSRFTQIEGERAYHTGDEVRCVDGELYYLGRLDEQIKRLGHRIDLLHLEEKLRRSLGFRVVGVSDGKRLLFVHAEDSGVSSAELMNRLQDLLPTWEMPDRIFLVPEFPLTSSGKTDRADLKNRLAELDTPSRAQTDDFATVLAIAEEVMGERLDPALSIYDLGGSSLTLVSIQVALGEVYGEELVEDAFQALEYDFSVQGFVDLLNSAESDDASAGTVTTFLSVTEDIEALRRELAATPQQPSPAPGTILITGASGFIGGHLFERALDSYPGVYVVTTADPKFLIKNHCSRFNRREATMDDVTFLSYEDIANPGNRIAVDTVVHGGYDVNHLLPLERHLRSSVRNTVHLVRAAVRGGVRKFSFLSAASSGSRFLPFSASALETVDDPYSQSKLVCEAYLSVLAEHGCSVDVHRIGLVYGHQLSDHEFLADDRFFNLSRLSVRRGSFPRIQGHIPVCHVNTVVDSILTAATKETRTTSILIEQTLDLDDLLAQLDLDRDAVVTPERWLELVRQDPTTDPRLLAMFQATPFDRGWETAVDGPHKSTILRDLMMLHGG